MPTVTRSIRAIWPRNSSYRLDNLEAVLAAADMTLANVVRLNFYARDVDELFKQFSRANERFGDARYATTVLGDGQLPARFLVMLEATAVD